MLDSYLIKLRIKVHFLIYTYIALYKDVCMHVLAEISNQALSSMFDEVKVNCSPVIGCKCGSIVTSWQTSASKLAVKSQISN